MKRDSASTIFRTVVFAGAMLGAPACSKKPAPVAPSQPAAAPPTATGGEMKVEGDKPVAGNPCADPCGGDPCGGDRPRGNEDEGGGVGRGFILS